MKNTIHSKIRPFVTVILFYAVFAFVVSGCGIRAGEDTDTVMSDWTRVSTAAPEKDVMDNPESAISDGDINGDVISDDRTDDESSGDGHEDEQPEPKEVSLVMVGDILLHKAVSDSGLQSDGTYNYDHFFVHVKDDIEAADIALVNQEVILGGLELGISGYPTFNGVYEVGDALVSAGFDVILHATNHALDKGTTGLNNCMNFWKENYPDITYTGINQSQEEQDEITVYEANGIRFAILNYTYGTNGIPMPADMPYAVNLLDEDKIRDDVEKARQQADFIIVCPHWGTEYVLDATDEQKQWCNLFLDLGVDLVLGTHPHVIEPVEWYEREDGHRMLVYYSLGNYINSTSSTERNVGWRYVGAMAKVTITDDGNGNISISDYGVEPLVTQKETGTGGITTYKLSDYTDELAAKNMAKKHQPDFSLQYCKDLCSQVFGDLYVPK